MLQLNSKKMKNHISQFLDVMEDELIQIAQNIQQTNPDIRMERSIGEKYKKFHTKNTWSLIKITYK